MTKEEANKLLEEHKYGLRACSIFEVTRALWVTGDLSQPVRENVETLGHVVFPTRFQTVRVGESEGT